jgi:RNA polymerase sigma factor (sigma-70 family)
VKSVGHVVDEPRYLGAEAVLDGGGGGPDNHGGACLMSNRETEIGGDLRQFPSTSWSSLGVSPTDDPAGRRARLERLVDQYWKPVYCVIRAGWSKSNEDAKDLTQEFFVRSVLEGALLDGFDPGRGSFRAYLKGALSHFMLNAGRDASTRKRGGDVRILSMEAEEAELSEFIPDTRNLPPDRVFDAVWKNAVLGQALRRLEQRLLAQGAATCFRIFQRYEFESGPDSPSYKVVADELGVTADVVKHALGKAREEFRCSVTEVLCGYTGTPELLAQELKDLFGS